MYARLENGMLIHAPKHLVINDTKVWNASPNEYISQGWFPVVNTDEPETDETHYADFHYEQSGNEIVQVWEVKESEPSAEEIVSILTGESA